MTLVLIVDDNTQNLYLLSAMLRGNGFEVREARNGADALSVARQTPPELIVTDLLMPVMDGYTLLRECKADERIRNIPVVVYTATYTEPRDEQLALSLGAQVFIVKPAEPEVLMERIREVLNSGANVAQPTAAGIDNAVVLKQYNEVLIRKLEKKVQELEQTNRDLLREMAERRRTEAALQQAQKMEAVGRLAAGVAHDFNNLLTVICSYSSLLAASPEATTALRDYGKAIQAAGERGSALTRQLLGFTRQTALQPKVLDLNQVVNDMSTLLLSLIGEPIVLVTNLDPALHYVKVDPIQLDQVLMNLAVNARDAMSRGTLTIATTDVVLTEEQVTADDDDAKPGRYAMLAVSDTGSGMTAEVRARMFEPYFTTKPLGCGTGLGLPMVLGIVQQSGGFIRVDTALGRGTTFKIYFPAVDEPIAVAPRREAQSILQGDETILVVEDDEAVREVVTEILKQRGYDILAAGDGEEALQLAQSNAKQIDLVLTDIVMPRMKGSELSARLAALFPHIKVLYMSGYAEDAAVRRGLLQSAVSFIQKPYTPLSLVSKVRELLDS